MDPLNQMRTPAGYSLGRGVRLYLRQKGDGPTDRLLLEAARAYAGERIPSPERVFRDKGRPFFLHIDGREAIEASVTHSGPYWLCALGPDPLGVDLQEHRPCRREAIARRFFHPDEAHWLENRPEEDFFRVWAAKESVVKLTGQGIDRDFPRFSVVNGGGIRGWGEVSLQEIPFFPGFSLCLAGLVPGK